MRAKQKIKTKESGLSDRKGTGRKITGWISLSAGIVCILYFLAIAFFMAHGTNFYFIWLLSGVIQVLLGISVLNGSALKIPGVIRGIFKGCVIIGLFLLVTVEGMICTGFGKTAGEPLDYLIVLGAQVRENGPSPVLGMRLDTAFEYLTEHQDTAVIVSGGQGTGEPFPEARGMYEYLVRKGISPERIIQEDTSRNTDENIRNSSAFFNKKQDRIGIVTNNFHVFRALKLAEKEGIEKVYGIAAPSYPGQLPNNMLREFFGVMKDFLFGNI